MQSMEQIKLLIVDDHPLFRQGLVDVVEADPGLTVVAQAAEGDVAIGYAEQHRPDIVLMDVNLPKMDGIAATREIKIKYPEIVVVGVTSMAEDYIVYAMLKAGAFEVLAKEKVPTDLYSTIQRAVASTHPILILKENQITPKTTPLVPQSDTVSGDVLHTPAEPGETSSS